MNRLFTASGLGFRKVTLWVTAGFVAFTLGASGVTVMSRRFARQATQQTHVLTDELLPSLVLLGKLQDAALNLKSVTYQFALAKDEAAMDAQRQAFLAALTQADAAIQELIGRSAEPAMAGRMKAFGEDIHRFRAVAEEFQTQLHLGQFEAAMATLDQRLAPAQVHIQQELWTIGSEYFRLSRTASAETAAVLARSDRFGLLATFVLGGFTIVCLALSLAATRTLLHQVQKRDAERLAAQAMLEQRVRERTAELQASEERIHLIVDTASDAIVSFDREGKIAGWNAQAERTFGWPTAAVIGRDVFETIFASSQRTFMRTRVARFLELRQNGEVHERIETLGCRQDGPELPIELTMSAAVIHGAPLITIFAADITERRRVERELKRMQHQVVEASHEAGRAEVATNVLHNVGNALNSVNVSAGVLQEYFSKTRIEGFSRIAGLLQQHRADLAQFLTVDEKGAKIPEYLAALAQTMIEQKERATEELSTLRKNVDHVSQIVALQQNFAKAAGVVEQMAAAELMEDAVRINAVALGRHGVEVVRDYHADLTIAADRQKVLQILINVIRNAKYACDESGRTDKQVVLRTAATNGSVTFEVKDNGIGIAPATLERMFTHGFTTRKDGHGFGLHSGALAAKEMGGTLTVASDGLGRGATFRLTLPFKQ